MIFLMIFLKVFSTIFFIIWRGVIVVEKCYFTFPTTHQAIRAEKVLEKTGWKFKMVPVPRRISASCGIALCCLPEEAESMKAYLEKEAVPVEGFYTLTAKVPAGPFAVPDREGERGI